MAMKASLKNSPNRARNSSISGTMEGLIRGNATSSLTMPMTSTMLSQTKTSGDKFSLVKKFINMPRVSIKNVETLVSTERQMLSRRIAAAGVTSDAKLSMFS